MPTTDFLKQAATVASHYGFVPIETAIKKYAHKDPLKKSSSCEVPVPLNIFGEELHFLMKNCVNSTIPKAERPIQVYHVRAKNSGSNARLTLTVLGVEKSIAEALILKSALTILNETHSGTGHVHINSVGDKDSALRFTRELSQFLRKNVNDMPIPCREALKRGAGESLASLFERKHPLAEQAPRAMQFLSDASRRHLKEVLEFLEMSETPYTINSQLVDTEGYHSQVLFEIHRHNDEDYTEDGEEDDNQAKVILARGGRFDDFTRKFSRTKFPAVSVVIEQQEKDSSSRKWAPPRVRRPKVYLIQLGSRAKLHSLSIIEMLRLAHIPVLQAIGDDSLTTQLEEATAHKIPYAIIMGQREALDGTVIIRDMRSHSQETISIEDLPNHFKVKIA